MGTWSTLSTSTAPSRGWVCLCRCRFPLKLVLFSNVSFFFLCAGEQADLIFVFFDPMGQALCKRTLNIVEKLSEKCGDKLMFYLSKADEAGSETDRQVGVSLPGRISLHPGGRRRVKGPVCLPLQRVMMQIVQELCRRPGLNKCGFEMPTIYIPNPQKVGPWCSHLYLSRNFNYIQILN